jgi:phospholipid/cholesterol/gamma-HCH transport system substrate-binding protein
VVGGVALVAAATMWLRGMTPGSQKYTIVAKFQDVGGIQQGGVVRYRGIKVGKVADLKPSATGVDVVMEITDANLKIPRNSIAEVSQVGLIGDPVIEITPQDTATALSPDGAKATDKNCDGNQIICNNGALSGKAGASFNELLRRATALISRYESPEIYNSLKRTIDNAGQAAADISTLSKKFGDLPDSIKQELTSLSSSANSLTKSLDGTVQNANGVITKVGKTTDQIAATTSRFGATADRFGRTADSASITAADFSKLARSVDTLINENRQTLGATLGNFNALSVDLRGTVNALNPTIAKLNDTTARINSQGLVRNLEGVLANANKTAANLRDISGSFNNPQTLLSLQQTLDSARNTFQTAQKIAADLDDITGDPNFRNNIKKLVNGLGDLVSSGETIEQQIRLAQELEPSQRTLQDSVATLSQVGNLELETGEAMRLLKANQRQRP